MTMTTRINGLSFTGLPECEVINEDDMMCAKRFYRIALSSIIGDWYGVFANSDTDALEILGAWCDDHAPGYIVDTTNMSDIDGRSYLYVNGAPDCALDLSEVTIHMFEEYTFQLTFKRA